MRALKNHMFGLDPGTETEHQQKTGEIWTKPILWLTLWHCNCFLLLHHKLLQNMYSQYLCQLQQLLVNERSLLSLVSFMFHHHCLRAFISHIASDILSLLLSLSSKHYITHTCTYIVSLYITSQCQISVNWR